MKYTDFTADWEKMRDFWELSKEEFLDLYSYLTDEEYELTKAKVKTNTNPEDKEWWILTKHHSKNGNYTSKIFASRNSIKKIVFEFIKKDREHEELVSGTKNVRDLTPTYQNGFHGYNSFDEYCIEYDVYPLKSINHEVESATVYSVEMERTICFKIKADNAEQVNDWLATHSMEDAVAMTNLDGEYFEDHIVKVSKDNSGNVIDIT